ncbi:MAG: glycosyltransferase family 2 protein [Eubacterium sp.]|nr:glycosyltransferase family 2 protein [Eubacterium sp.]
MKEINNKPGITIIMPCKNEANAIPLCINEAKAFMNEHNLRGEILVVDNASTDGSGHIARSCGARVIHVSKPGYGRTLRAGIKASHFPIIAMGDCDTTYNFNELWPMYSLLYNCKCDMVIGNRFTGNMEKGAMPLSHKLGVNFLSALGRWRYRVNVKDFHCGLRALSKEAAGKLSLRTTGMEFATEMIAQAKQNNLKILETPVTLRRSKCNRSSKLHAIRDGIRHVGYIFHLYKK